MLALALVILFVTVILPLLVAGGLALGAGVAVAGENICRALNDVFGVVFGPIIAKIGPCAFAMLIWLILFLTST